MRTLVSLLAWTSGTLGLLVGLFLMVLTSFLVPARPATPIYQLLFRFMVRAFLVRVRLEGRERIDPAETCLYMCNHASFFDLFILAGWLPGYVRGLEAGEHFHWPVWGFVVKRIDMIPIDRSSGAASMRSIHAAVERLDAGVSILVLPEGTRTRTGRMLPFNRLPFHLARKAGRSIVPVGLRGTFGIKSKNSWRLKPGRVDLLFGEPIPAETVRDADSKELMALTERRVAELCGDPGPADEEAE